MRRSLCPAFTLAVMDRLTGAGNFAAAGCSRQPPQQRMQPTSAHWAEFSQSPPAAGGRRNVRLMHARASRLQLMRAGR